MHVRRLHPSPCQSEPHRMDGVWTGKAFALY
jgi:hypothetical protein